MMPLPHRLLRAATVPLAIASGLLLSGVLIWHSTDAAFTATTTTPSNSFSSGKVAISNGASGSSLFSVNNLVPSSTGVACVDVTYSGTVASNVKFYATSGASNALSPYLTFQIDQIGADAACTSSAAAVANLYGGASSATLDGLVSSANGYGTGLGSWAPNATATQRYRFIYTLQDTNAAQNLSTQVGFTWEARSTGP